MARPTPKSVTALTLTTLALLALPARAAPGDDPVGKLATRSGSAPDVGPDELQRMGMIALSASAGVACVLSGAFTADAAATGHRPSTGLIAGTYIASLASVGVGAYLLGVNGTQDQSMLGLALSNMVLGTSAASLSTWGLTLPDEPGPRITPEVIAGRRPGGGAFYGLGLRLGAAP